MGRPKKSAVASRSNGSLATNKGKAKTTVPVVVCTYDGKEDGYTISTEKRPVLPKGYAAYESELEAHQLVIAARISASSNSPKDGLDFHKRHRQRMKIRKQAELEALKMLSGTKGQDAGSKLSKLKALTDGSDVKFAFKTSVVERPRRGQRRAA